MNVRKAIVRRAFARARIVPTLPALRVIVRSVIVPTAIVPAPMAVIMPTRGPRNDRPQGDRPQGERPA